MKKGWILLVAVTLIFAVLAGTSHKDSIVICTSIEQFRIDVLQEQLAERFPQYNVIVMYMSTGKLAAKVYAEGTKTEADILLALESGYLTKLKDNFEDISGLSKLPYTQGMTPADNQNLWVTWERFAGAIVVNRDILDRYGLQAPTCYEDLLKEEYRGLVAMPDPKSSSTGYFFYKNWVNLWGEQGALEYVDKLYKNIKQFTESGSGPLKLLKQGEIAVALGMTFQAVSEQNEGQPFELIIPETGSPYSLTGTAVIKGRLEQKGVAEVYDFLINEFMVYDKEHYSPETVYEGQKNLVPNYPQDVVYADMTGIQDDKEKERLLALWKY